MIILGQQHRDVAPAIRAAAFCRGLPLLAGLALGAAGCSQTMTQPVAEASLGPPMVLNSAAGAVPPAASAGAPAVPPGATAATPPPAPAAPTATATATAAAPAPAPPTALQPQPAAATPPPADAVAAKDGAFPNINKPPTQPGGTLLAPAARAQIIAELEALRNGQAAPPASGGGKPSELADQAQTHGQAAIRQIELCSQDGALENNPACAAPAAAAPAAPD